MNCLLLGLAPVLAIAELRTVGACYLPEELGECCFEFFGDVGCPGGACAVSSIDGHARRELLASQNGKRRHEAGLEDPAADDPACADGAWAQLRLVRK